MLSRLIQILSLSGFFIFLCSFVYVVVSRLHYPFELEWMEGEIIAYLKRLIEGKPIYHEPNFEFTPFLYNYLYFKLSQWVMNFGVDPLYAGRYVSVASSIGILAVLYKVCRSLVSSPYIALLGPALLLASYEVSGAWLDIARVDTLFIFMILMGIFCLLKANGRQTLVLISSFFFFLAFLAKQSALAMAAPIGVIILIGAMRQGLVFLGSLAVLVGFNTYLWDLWTQGWYSYYIFELPRQHKWLSGMILGFWTEDMFFNFWALIVLVFTAVILGVASLRAGRYSWLNPCWHNAVLLGVVLGGFACAYLSRLHNGGYINVLLPAILALSVLLSVSVDYLVFQAIHPGRKGLLLATIFLLGLGFFSLVYPPLKFVPTKEDHDDTSD